MLAKHLGDARSPIYYLVGSPGMVSGLQKMLNESGIDDADIRTEGFSGCKKTGVWFETIRTEMRTRKDGRPMHNRRSI